MKSSLLFITLCIFFSSANPLFAKTKLNPVVESYLNNLQQEARKEDPSFQFFSAKAGQELYDKEFFHSKKKENRSCHSCHTEDPTAMGRHKDTGKKIKPLAPVVNRSRFQKKSKIDKWFKRNCKWVMERTCTAKEKGDFLVWVFSL